MATPAPLIPTAALVPGASKATDQLTASAWEEGDWNSSELRGGISNEGDMTIRILFFDTSTLIKMFVKEDGSENIQWLSHPETKICNSLQFFVNDQVCLEFENKITYFEKTGRISKNKSDQILDAFASHWAIKGDVPVLVT